VIDAPNTMIGHDNWTRQGSKTRQRDAEGTLKAEGKTQADIAERLGVARNTMSDWLGRGRTDVEADNSAPIPDCRVKVPQQIAPVIPKRA